MFGPFPCKLGSKKRTPFVQTVVQLFLLPSLKERRSQQEGILRCYSSTSKGVPGIRESFHLLSCFEGSRKRGDSVLSATKLASQNRSDHSFSPRRPQKIAITSDFWGYPQNRKKLAATMAAGCRSRTIMWPQRPWDTRSWLLAI